MIAKACPEYSLDKASTLIAVSGSGNVTQGYTKEFVHKIGQLKLHRGSLEIFSKEPGYTYHAGKRPWTLIPTIHIALTGATQNEVSGEEAEALVKAGVRIVAEGSNMGCTTKAIDVFESSRKSGHGGVWYAPGNWVFPDGVAVSGLEMAQNSQRLNWTSQEVDGKLKGIMAECYRICLSAGTKLSGKAVTDHGLSSLLSGVNVAGFIKVVDAMKEHGDWW